MKRLIALFILISIVAMPLAAQQPKAPVKHRIADKKFWLLTAASVGASVAASFAVNRCRRDHGIGPCTDGGYGEFKTREVLRQGLTAFLILPTYKIKKIEDEDGAKHKFWWLFEAGNIGLNAGVIAQNAGKHYGPKRERD
jgi:hypothetical protein